MRRLDGQAYLPISAGFLVWVVCLCELAGLCEILWLRDPAVRASDELLRDRSWAARALLSGGTLLVLIGFLHGSYYAGAHLFRYEARDSELLSAMTTPAAAGDSAASLQAVADYGQLQDAKAVNIAAHAHVIEFGVLAILLAFFQPYVFLSESWRRIWVVVLLIGSLALPFFVLMELRGDCWPEALAELGGLLVIIALFAMLVGIWRYTGKTRFVGGCGMTFSRKLLVFGGLALAIWGMGYGIWYAVFIEHQTLDGLGAALATGFIRAAENRMAESQAALADAAIAKLCIRSPGGRSWTLDRIGTTILILGIEFRPSWIRRAHAQCISPWRFWQARWCFLLACCLKYGIEGIGPQASQCIGSALVILGLSEPRWDSLAAILSAPLSARRSNRALCRIARPTNPSSGGGCPKVRGRIGRAALHSAFLLSVL